MKNLTNPAARLIEIINQSRLISSSYTCAHAWSTLLNIQTSETALLLNRISKIFALPDEIEEKIITIGNNNTKLLLKWRPVIRRAFGDMNFQKEWATHLKVFTDEVMYGIAVCEDVLARTCPEQFVEANILKTISSKIVDLMQFIETDSIEFSSKRFILSSLFSLKNSIEELNICGAPGIEKAFNTVIGSIVVNSTTSVLPNKSKSASKFWEILSRIAIVLAIVTGPIAIGHEIVNLIPANQDSHEDEANKINKDVIVSTYKQTPRIIKQRQRSE